MPPLELSLFTDIICALLVDRERTPVKSVADGSSFVVTLSLTGPDTYTGGALVR